MYVIAMRVGDIVPTVDEVMSMLGLTHFGPRSVLGDGDCAVRAGLMTVLARRLPVLEDVIGEIENASIPVVRAGVAKVILEDPLFVATLRENPEDREAFLEQLFGEKALAASDADIAARIKTCGNVGGPWFSSLMMGALAIVLQHDIAVVFEGGDGRALMRVYPKVSGYYKYDTVEESVYGNWKPAASGIDFSEYLQLFLY